MTSTLTYSLNVPNASHTAYNADTLVPPSYDALEAEAYHLLPDVCERDTELPPPSVQLTLELECAGLEAW